MCPCNDPDICTQPTPESPETPAAITPAPDTASTPEPFWARRTLLKAAALGTAAAALANKGTGGLRLGPLTASAEDLSTFQCTAGDVEILGSGQVINEPCDCKGTFDATIQFTVRNNAASDRGCITVHLSDGRDIKLNNGDPIPGKTKQVMTGTLKDFKCGSGLVCFGQAGEDGRRRCDPGTCSTVSWTVPGQDTCPPAKQISSKCRHQQICIQGRGSATLDCDTSTDGVQGTCKVPCGSKTTLKLCTSADPSVLGPFTFELGGTTINGSATQTCADFTVGPLTDASTTFTGNVTDKSGCTKSAKATVTTAAVKPTITLKDTSPCNGVLSLGVKESCSSISWTIDGTAAANTSTDTLLVRVNADGTLDYRNLDDTCHTIGVTATCGGCTGSNSKTVKQGCVPTTLDCTPAGTAARAAAKKQTAASKRKAPTRGTGRRDRHAHE